MIAAHDAGDGFNAVVVADHSEIRIDIDGLTVEQFALLAFFTPANSQRTVKLIEVKNMSRTAELEHDVIGNVHQRRNRTLSRTFQAVLHPLRRRSLRIYAADHTAGEPSAKIRGLIAYFVNAVAGGRSRREIREGKLGTGQRSQIAADTDHA